MTGAAAAARILRERAASYARDAEVLLGADHEAAAILTTMRDELRKVANEMDDMDDPCQHKWTDRGVPGDWWRECWLCGAQRDVPEMGALRRPQNSAITRTGDAP